MRMLRLAMAAIFSASIAGNAHAVTIVNGSFEDTTGLILPAVQSLGTPAGWGFDGPLTSGGFGNVQALPNSVFPIGNTDGERYVEVFNNQTEQSGALFQDITGLDIGTEYEISFLTGNRAGDYELTVSIADALYSESGSGLVDFVARSLIFSASSTVERLSINWGTDTTSGALDNFVISETGVSAIPIPAALPLLATALAGLGLVSWRRKRASA